MRKFIVGLTLTINNFFRRNPDKVLHVVFNIEGYPKGHFEGSFILKTSKENYMTYFDSLGDFSNEFENRIKRIPDFQVNNLTRNIFKMIIIVAVFMF